PKSGMLELVATVPGVSVQLDGVTVGVTPLHLSLPPGRHEVQLYKPGYLPAHRWVSLSAGAVTQEQVSMQPIPGAEEASLGALPSPPLNAEPSAGIGRPYRLPWPTYLVGGLGVAAAAVGVGFGASAANIDRNLRASYDPTTQVYGGTRADALRARSQAITA